MHTQKIGKLPQLTALAIAVHAVCGVSAWAGGTGATVVNGQVSIAQPNSQLQQITATNGAIINWKGFGTAAGETVQFIQPSAASAVLNRVVGSSVSSLMGQLKANGNVFLINPNGIVVGSAARIDTNSFLASTLDMADSDFLAGKLRFFAGAGAGRITNDGLITAGPGGRIALIAPNIENSGIIRAPDGNILLAAGRSLEITSLDMEGVTFQIQAPADSILNLGKLLAENGAVRAFAGTLRHSGEIQASRLVQQVDGSVVLSGSNDLVLTSDSSTRANGTTGGSVLIQSAGGTARAAGKISATASDGTGGDIRILGERVAVDGGTLVDASGSAGGGQILVGGDFQGKNQEVQNAQRVYVGAGAQLKADATLNGDGGRVIVWADQNTRYHGNLSVQGGATGGNGGFAEVSGKGNLEFAGSANLSAAAGTSGTLLLDPLDIIVSNVSGILPEVADEFAEFSANVVTVSPDALAAVGGNVTLQAERDIYIDDAISLTASGAGLTATAGGADFTAGSIHNNGGINTVGGAVTLRAAAISGAGGISTGGGAVDLLTSGALIYSSAIASAGGSVTLGSQTSSVISANVDSGAGAIQVSANGVFGGSYTTTGTASLTATAGGIGSSSVTADTINLDATSSISGVTVNAASRVNATSTESSINLSGQSGRLLRLGTLTAQTGLFLNSNAGMVQADGGLLTAPTVELNMQNSSVAAGSAAAPISIATPRLNLFNVAAPANVALSGSPTLTQLTLQGTVAGLGGSVITGAANLSSLSLGAGSGELNLSATSTGGFGSNFSVNVRDGGLNASNLTLPTARITLDSAGSMTLGNISGDRLSATAGGGMSVNLVETTGGGGIFLSASQNCSQFNACTLFSPITATTLTAGGSGSINVTNNFDNGNISLGTLSAGGAINVTAGQHFFFFPRASAIAMGSATAGSSITVKNGGTGGLTVSGNLASTSGNLSLDADDGDISAMGAHTARGAITVSASAGKTIALGTLASTNASVNVTAGSNVEFQSISASGEIGDVYVSSDTGSIKATVDNAAADITAGRSVVLTATDAANGTIGNAAFARPMDIVASATSDVALSAGKDIGAVGKELNIDAGGVIEVTTSGGEFFVSAESMGGAARSVSGIRLSASASGMTGSGTSTFASQDLSVNATSDGSTITIGDVQQFVGVLNEFRFTALDGGLTFGDVVLTTTGLNQLYLQAQTALTQVTPGTNNVSAGYINLTGFGNVMVGDVTSAVGVGNSVEIAGGDISAGDITGPGMHLTGRNMTLGDLMSTGTLRGASFVFVPRLGFSTHYVDSLYVNAAGVLAVSGNVSSATSLALLGAGGVTVSGGIDGGNNPPFYADSVTIDSFGSTLTSGTIDGYNVTVRGDTLNTGNVTANGSITFGNSSTSSISTGTLTSSGGLSVSSTTFNTGNLTAGGALNITAGAAYAPAGLTLTGSSANINAAGGIDLVTGSTSLTATTVSLTSAAGNVDAALTNTTNLTLNVHGRFDVSSTGTLTGLSVTADGSAAGAGIGSSVSASGGSQNMTVLGPPSALALDVQSSSALNFNYFEADPLVSDLALTSAMSSSGNVHVNAYLANITTPSVMHGGAGLSLYTDGQIDFNTVRTGGGAVTARSGSSDIRVADIVTLGGSVSLTADAGSILKAGAQPLQIDMRNGAGVASGTLSLKAPSGSVGMTGTPLLTSGAVTLDVSSQDDIALDLANTPLSNLYIQTATSGSGSIVVTNSNFATLSLTRSGSDLLLAGVSPGAAGIFSLTANDGNIKLTSDLSNVTSLTLHATSGDVVIQAGGGARSVSANSYDFRAGRDVVIAAGAGAGDNVTVAAIGTSGNSSIYAANDIKVLANGGSALVSHAASGWSQTLHADHDFKVVGGSAGASNASAAVTSSGSQTLRVANDFVIQGGSSDGALARVEASQSQFASYINNLSVLGGGNDASASLTGTSQNLNAVDGNIMVMGGSGTDAFGRIEALTGSQHIGYFQYYNYAGNITVQGGAGTGAAAAIRAASFQSINSEGDVKVLGGAGSGANAEILSSAGSQTIGDNYIYYVAATRDVLVQGGAGGTARIRASGSQTINVGNDISVIGGSGANTTASIESTGGSQNFGETFLFSYYDPSHSILVRGGSGVNAAAWMSASTGQTIDAGGTITVEGGAAGSFAEITTASGSQSLGNVSGSNDQTDSIAVSGGSAAGAYARIATADFQNVQSAGNIALAGGVGTGSGAGLFAGTGQNVISYGNLSLVGGSGSAPGSNETAIRNTSSGTQYVYAASNIGLTGGGFGSDTWIKQDGSGSQIVGAGGSLSLVSPAATPNTGVTSIEASDTQSISAGGAISIDNQAGWIVYIASGGAQTVQAESLSVLLSSENLPGPTASLSAGGDQSIMLYGDGETAGTATVTVANFSGQANSIASIAAGGNQTILMDYHAAGLLQIGDVASKGLSTISSEGDQTTVAGELLIQGGVGAGSDAKLQAPDTMTISALFGGLTMNGGVNGASFIDPTQLDIVVNGPVTLQAGTNPTADATITAGIAGQPDTVNIAATNGRMRLIQSPAATATINGFTLPLADPPPFNLIDSSDLGLNPEKPDTENPNLGTGSEAAKEGIRDVLALLDVLPGLFEIDESGNLVQTRRRLNQCY